MAETRALPRGIDWGEVQMTERTENLGLGRNVLAGVTDSQGNGSISRLLIDE